MIWKLLLFLFIPLMAFSQTPPVFQILKAENALSQNHVNHLLKDKKGFVWVATQDGLNRFDGYRFRSFFHEPGNPASLANNFVWKIFEDSRGHLWFGTFGGGLCRFDRATETFRTFRPATSVPGNSIRSMCEFPEGTLHLGTDGGLWHFDLLSEEFLPTAVFDTLALKLTNVTAIHPLADGQLLVGAAEGIFRYGMENPFPTPLLFGGTEVPGVTDFTHVGEEIWAGGIPGIFRLKYFGGSDSVAVVGHISPKKIDDENRLANAVTALHFDREGRLWAGSLDGLHLLENPLSFSPIFSHFGTADGLPDSQVTSLLAAEPGFLMAGTRQGIGAWKNAPPLFQKINARTHPSLCSEVVLGMAEATDGTLWLGTKEGLVGLPSVASSGHLVCLTPENTPGMGDAYVINVKKEAGEVWATFWRGGAGRLVRGETGGFYFEKIPGLNHLTNGAGIHDLITTPDGAAWLATPNRGLIRWDQTTNELTAFTPDSTALTSPYIFHLMLDDEGQLWLGSANGGLCRMNPRTGIFDCHLHDPAEPESLGNNMVLSTFQDSQKRIWACTAGGLNLWLGKGRFRRFSKKDGLPNSVVYGMVEDGEGNLWVSTNGGLAKVTFGEGIFVSQNFNLADGLQGNEFNQYSFLNTKNGHLLFGGTGGLTFFDPLKIKPSEYVPPVSLTDFQLFGHTVPVGGEGDFVLEKNIDEVAEITLQHNQNFIAFEFAALGFSQPENIEYAYQMTGLDEEWVLSGHRRFVNFPNLPPGEYEFRVQAANHDGVWGEGFKSLKINVLKPWWARWWAYVFYFMAVAVAVFGVVRFRENSIRRLERAKAGERERFRKRTARDFHDEAGNRITKLALLTEVAKRRAGADTALLGQVEENIQALRTGMRDFIWVLDPEHDNLFEALLRLKDFGHGLFEHSGIRFRTEGIGEKLRQVPFGGSGRRHLVLLFKESMNNCAKHSKATEAVFSVEQKKGQATITFSDNGKGFEEKKPGGNGLRNMRERAAKMGAVFSMKTKNGTTVRVLLKN